MAVLAGIYGEKEPKFVGCVLDTYERNGYNDSDWYAVCWNKEKNDVEIVNYDTTRAGGGGWAEIDATEDVVREYYRYHKKLVTSMYDAELNPSQARKVTRDDYVVVIKGRKVKKGTICKAFWVGTRYNPYNRANEDRVGLELENGERVFVPAENVEPVGWEKRLVTGKHRKKIIRRMTVKRMPFWCRNIFVS